jgi:hypothetical protein
MNSISFNYHYEYSLNSTFAMGLEKCFTEKAYWNHIKQELEFESFTIAANGLRREGILYSVQLRIPRLTPTNPIITKDFEVLCSFRKLKGVQGVVIIIPAKKWIF